MPGCESPQDHCTYPAPSAAGTRGKKKTLHSKEPNKSEAHLLILERQQSIKNISSTLAVHFNVVLPQALLGHSLEVALV